MCTSVSERKTLCCCCYGSVHGKFKLVSIDWSLLSSSSNIYTYCFSLIGNNFASNYSRYMVQRFVLEVLMSSFERYPSWKITIPLGVFDPRGGVRPLLKQKLYIDWIFLFQIFMPISEKHCVSVYDGQIPPSGW